MDDKLLTQIVKVLKQVGGYFAFEDEAGTEFVVANKADFDKKRMSSLRQKQLTLGGSMQERETEHSVVDEEKDDGDEVHSVVEDEPQDEIYLEGESIDDFLERINREIALYRLQQEEAEKMLEDEVDDEEGELDSGQVLGREKIRFEPLRGDLSPDLQE